MKTRLIKSKLRGRGRQCNQSKSMKLRPGFAPCAVPLLSGRCCCAGLLTQWATAPLQPLDLTHHAWGCADVLASRASRHFHSAQSQGWHMHRVAAQQQLKGRPAHHHSQSTIPTTGRGHGHRQTCLGDFLQSLLELVSYVAVW